MDRRLYNISEEDQSSEVTTISQVSSPLLLSQEYLIGIIADEDTCVGYLLGGIGELNENGEPNYYIFTETTDQEELITALFDFLQRPEIGILLIQKEAFDNIHYLVKNHQISKFLPIIIEIPGKNGPYDISIDYILNIADTHEKVREEKLNERRQSLTDKKLQREHSDNKDIHKNIEKISSDVASSSSVGQHSKR